MRTLRRAIHDQVRQVLYAISVLALAGSPLAGQSTNPTLLDGDAIRTAILVPFPESYPNQIPRNHAPTINANGDTAFPIVTAPGGERVVSLWAEVDETAFLVASEFFQAPGFPGDVMPSLNVNFPPSYNAEGQISFGGGVFGDGIDNTNNGVIWSGQPAALRVIARTGFQAPDAVAGVTFDSFARPAMNAAGAVVYRADFSGPGVTFENDRGIWIDDGAEGRLIVRTGDAAPQTGPDIVFHTVDQPQVVASGAVLFGATLRDSEGRLNQQFGRGAWALRNGQLEKVVRGGDDAPGFNGEAQYSFVTKGHMNRAGEVAFYASLTGPAVSNGTDALWREYNGAVELVAMEGQPAPIEMPGATLGEMDLLVSHNILGDVAWRGVLEGVGIGGANDEALFVGKDGQIQVIAREDDLVPGGYAGSNGQVFERFESFSYPVLNDRGQVAFLAETSTSRFGIWAQNANGELQLIAAEDSEFDVDDSEAVDLRQIRSLRFYDGQSGQDGAQTGFNDRGQIAFAAQFFDGTQGVFVSNAVALQEGDYNADGVVDSIDYALWRENLGMPPGALYNDVDGGVIGAAQFATWRTNYSGTLPGSAATVPEPLAGGLTLLLVASLSSIRCSSRSPG